MQTASISIGGCHLRVAQQGSGSPLLLIHGFPLDHTMWSGQLEGLSRWYRVIAPDLRGFGGSGGEGEPVMRMEQFADDLARLLDVMKIDEPVALGGLSMGGYIAWQFWTRHRNRLAQLILCDTRAVADTQEAGRQRLETAERVLQEGSGVVAQAMLPKLFAPETAAQQPELLEATDRVMRGNSPQTVAAALRGMAERPDFSPLLPRIDLHTLVICGEHDGIATPAEMQAMARAIPTAEYAEIAGAGHMAPLEKPQSVNEAIRRFLSEKRGA
jgi:3-oxoadipate enol-lactonase